MSHSSLNLHLATCPNFVLMLLTHQHQTDLESSNCFTAFKTTKSNNCQWVTAEMSYLGYI